MKGITYTIYGLLFIILTFLIVLTNMTVNISSHLMSECSRDGIELENCLEDRESMGIALDIIKYKILGKQ